MPSRSSALLTNRFADTLWAEYGGALMVDGASLPRSAFTILAIGRASLLTTFLAAFGRAISEVGAIIVVGGNIRRLHPYHDDSDRSGDQQGRPRARARARHGAHNLVGDRERDRLSHGARLEQMIGNAL